MFLPIVFAANMFVLFVITCLTLLCIDKIRNG